MMPEYSSVSQQRPRGIMALEWLEYFFVVLAFLAFSRALMYPFFGFFFAEPADTYRVISQPQRLWIYAPIYLFSGIVVLRHGRAVMELLLREKSIFFLLALAWLSGFWSHDTREVLVKSTAITGCTLFAVYLRIRFTALQAMRLLTIAIFIAMVASVIAALYLPELGLMHWMHEGLWRGVFPHKNLLGRVATVGLLTAFFLALIDRRYRWYHAVSAALALFLLVMSSSKTALLASGFLFMAAGIILAWKRIMIAAATAIIVSLVSASCFFLVFKHHVAPPLIVIKFMPSEAQKSFYDKRNRKPRSDAKPRAAQLDTVGGRRELWGYIGEAIAEKPLLGFGFDAFWVPSNEAAAKIWNQTTWRPPRGHNGFLDLWLELGAVGLFVFLAGLSRGFWALLAFLKRTDFAPLPLFYTSMLFSIVIANLASSDLLKVNNLVWILYVWITLGLSLLRIGPAKSSACGNGANAGTSQEVYG